jgi:hypothetical protein
MQSIGGISGAGLKKVLKFDGKNGGMQTGILKMIENDNDYDAAF